MITIRHALPPPAPRPHLVAKFRKDELYQVDNSSIMLMHNHPSGDPSPSQADIQMTRAIVDIAKPLGIAVHDHIIVGKDGHASFKALKLI